MSREAVAGPILRVNEPKKASARCLQYIGFSKICENVGTAFPPPRHLTPHFRSLTRLISWQTRQAAEE